MSLTDEQCREFRNHPGTFYDMTRAVYEAGAASTGKLFTEADMLLFADYAIDDRGYCAGLDADADLLAEWVELKKEGGLHDRE